MSSSTDCAGIAHLLVAVAIGLAVSPLQAFRAMSEAAVDALETGRGERTPSEVGNATRTCARVYDFSAYRRPTTGTGGGVA
ncbi:hypothetical protein [Aromatoleum anaerobium]|uniref:Uncharacterized protein n=1 Tax=Aromatoleum anaerobium TaxID=182180 RepID=A0ABX1PHP6_9RHOO|nr:hypothetical protein [Aromatoleum anaerobium]MCK0507538.1 hypothetical protein [Aromatoleum anaerobium]